MLIYKVQLILFMLLGLAVLLLYFDYFLNRSRKNKREFDRMSSELLTYRLQKKQKMNELILEIQEELCEIASSEDLERKTKHLITPITSKKKRLRKKETKRQALLSDIYDEHQKNECNTEKKLFFI